MRKTARKACVIIGILLLFVSAALLAYNEWDSARAGKASQQVLAELEQALPQTTEQPASAGESTPPEPEQVLPLPVREMTAVELDGWEYIGYLSIPSIGLELPVMSQWSDEGLKIAPGRYAGSVYTDDLVICGHNYARHFSPIKRLPVGAQVVFTDMDGQRWEYAVSSVDTLQPDDVEKMTQKDQSGEDWALTLFTCTTGGGARCTVRCVRVSA